MGAALLFTAALIPGPLIGVIALVLSLLFFINGIRSDFVNTYHELVVISLLVALPVSFFISAVFLDWFSQDQRKADLLQGIFTVFGLWLVISSGYIFDYLERWISLGAAFELSDMTLLLIDIGSAAIFVASSIALSVIFLSLLIELPFAWATNSSSIKINICLTAIRPLIVIFILSLASQLIISFVLRQFAAAAIIQA